MWEAIKVIGGLILLAGLILGVLTTAFVFSWVFKIIGALIVVLAVLAFLGYCVVELISGWWQDRRNKK